MDRYMVEREGVGRFVIVAQGEPPLPATFDSWKTAQSVADRLNARFPADEAVGGDDRNDKTN